MPKTLSSNDDVAVVADSTAHRQLSAMIDAGRAFSGNERNCCFLNTRNGSFADLSAGSGLNFPDDGRGVAVTDWDQDGDLDLWISNRNGPRVRLLLNEAASGNHFLALSLQGNGKTTNLDAIGARVEVKLLNDKSGARLVRSLRAGEGFLSQSSKSLHFGLGAHTKIDQVVVRWPDGTNERFTGFNADRRYVLSQGTGKAEPLPPRSGPIRLRPSVPPIVKSVEAARIPAVTLLRAPTLNIKRSDGSRPGISAGRSLLINLWATWCDPCRAELEEIRDRANDLRDANVGVLALNVDEIGEGQEFRGPATARNVIAELKFPFAATVATEPLVAALQELNNNLVGLNRPLPVPTSFLIDPQGRLSVIYKGPISVDQLLTDIDHSAGTLAERQLCSAQIGGSLIKHPTVRRSAKNHEASLHLRNGLARQIASDFEGAEYHFLEAINLNPQSAAAAKYLARNYLAGRQWAKAADQFAIAIELNPDDPDGHLELAQLRARLGQPDKARLHYAETLRLNPKNPRAHFGFAALLAAQGEPVAAASHYRSGLIAQPENRFAANNLAWLLATHPSEDVRDSTEALGIAVKLNEASGDKVPNILDTLGAAQAATGDYEAAAKTVQRAIAIARASGDEEFAADMTERLALYHAGTSYLETSVQPGGTRK